VATYPYACEHGARAAPRVSCAASRAAAGTTKRCFLCFPCLKCMLSPDSADP
jgi:hypothetical protein